MVCGLWYWLWFVDIVISVSGRFVLCINFHINLTNSTLQSLLENAACNGNLGILKWIVSYENDLDFGAVCEIAATSGHLDILKWARANRCEWDYYTCLEAARGGHLEILKWAIENGCAWNSFICGAAANNGLGCIKVGKRKWV